MSYCTPAAAAAATGEGSSVLCERVVGSLIFSDESGMRPNIEKNNVCTVSGRLKDRVKTAISSTHTANSRNPNPLTPCNRGGGGVPM